MYTIQIVSDGVHAANTIESLQERGFDPDDIYVFAHNKVRSETLTTATETNDVGIREQGFFESVGNIFRSRGDELRSKMRALGLSQVEAEHLEEELDVGKIVVIGSDQASTIKNTEYLS